MECFNEIDGSKATGIDKVTKDMYYANLNYNLDQCGYPVNEEVILSPKETMDNFISKREELEKQLDEKLKVIMQLIGDLK